MIRTIAAALAAFVLVSFSAKAEDTAKSDTSTTATKTDSAGNTMKTEKKSHKKMKKAKKADDTAAPAADKK